MIPVTNRPSGLGIQVSETASLAGVIPLVLADFRRLLYSIDFLFYWRNKLKAPATTVATITIFQLVNDFNWGSATAFTGALIVMAIAVLSAVWLVSGRRTTLPNVARG